jgi:class 3 adenylate cyclase/tetratricopeptide (TPR) repeat protein
MIVCPGCGQENPDVARFCFACATPLDATPGGEERKVVTVLFADLVGFTSRAEAMDPEDVRALLAPYHQRLRAELERYGGTVEKFIGDAVVALFGAPVAHEDDPERAVRAALSIRDWVREEEKDLQLRIAVNTGEALIALGARPEAGEGMASGDVVNTTARLQSAAPVNGILVGEATWRATRDRIDYQERDPVAAKGKAEPVPVWEPLHAHARLGMDLEQHTLTPLVGRERELGTLLDAFERVCREREPQLVTLVGVPGIGKSRLVAEVFRRIDESPELVWWRQGRALPYGAGVSFWALGEMVKAQTGIHENDSAEDARESLRISVEQTVDAHEREWVRRHLEPLVGLGDEVAVNRDEAFTAWRRYLEGLAEQHPLVLVFEDLHWADEGLLDFVDHLAEWAGGVPLLVLGTARPELLDRRPGWGGGKLNAATLALSPLADVEAARVIAAVLDQAVLPAETQEALLDRAGGNPLYAEQFARLFLERQTVDELPLPENVQGIIAARLDALSSGEKRVLQDAAVLGKVFWSGGVAALTGLDGDELGALIHLLERKGFVRRERRSAVAGQTELAFRHVIVREVAYGQVPRATRADKHIGAVGWLESLGRTDDHAELVAHHYSTALELLEAAGNAPSAELVARASRALRSAGDRADALNAHVPAAEYYRGAMELSEPGSPERAVALYGLARSEHLAGIGEEEIGAAVDALLTTGQTEVAAEAELLASEAAWQRGDREERRAHVGRALELTRPLPASRAKAWILSQASRYAMFEARYDESIAYGRAALEMAAELDLPEVRIHALNSVGVARAYLGEPEGMADLDACVSLAEQLNSSEAGRALHNLCTLRYVTGDLATAVELMERAISSAERFGNVPAWRFSRSQLPSYYFRAGRWDEALALVEEFLEEETGASYAESACLEVRSLIRSARGDHEGATEDAALALEIARRVGDPQALYPALATNALVLAASGDHERGRLIASEILDREADSPDRLPFGAPGDIVDSWITLAGAERVERFARGSRLVTRWAEAALAMCHADLETAVDLYERAGSVSDAALARLRLARRLVEGGRRAEADIHLHQALAFYRSVGATRYIREGEELLAATA